MNSTLKTKVEKKFCFFLIILLCSLMSCSPESEPRTPISESGLHKYIFKSLDIDFYFDYEIHEYKIYEIKDGGFSEQWKVVASDEVINKIAVYQDNKETKRCMRYDSPPGENPVFKHDESVLAYKCRVDLYDDGLELFAHFKTDSNIITIAIRKFTSSGVF